MKKLVVRFAFLANLILILACSQEQPSKEQLIGTWKHPIEAGWVSMNEGEKMYQYNYEIFRFKEDGTFLFGEYGDSPLYEVNGRWELSDDKKSLVFSYDDGETSSIDIREFTGDSFITTSREGNDFKYTKE
ncbi:MAG: hypothetical protein J5767_14645 [Paludibacteraceae bacterium]|nr:hypothetical protein [Paludibacteraceae bacterium]